jgi:catecholate siderophore receptor
MIEFRCRPLAAAVIAVVSTCAQAQEQTLPEVKVRGEAERADGPVGGYRATRSSTATKTDTPLNEVPASVSVVPAGLMKDQAMQGMGDVFRYVPGVVMHQGEGNRDQIVIRGTSTTADFYVDGVRDDAQVFRDLYNLERVEILKGPAGMVFGRGGAGGVVNRVTRKPALDPVGEMRLTVGSWNQLRDTVDLGRSFGDSSAWRLNAMAENSGSFRKDVSLHRWAVNPTAMVQSESSVLTLGYEHLNDERTADPTGASPRRTAGRTTPIPATSSAIRCKARRARMSIPLTRSSSTTSAAAASCATRCARPTTTSITRTCTRGARSMPPATSISPPTTTPTSAATSSTRPT